MTTMIIDTDTASDDAVALAMALRRPDVEVAAVTAVAGNCPVEQAARNALYTAELCGSEVPVFLGAAGPIRGRFWSLWGRSPTWRWRFARPRTLWRRRDGAW